MNINIMASRKASTSQETRKSVATVVAASRVHSINPIAPTSLDSSASTDNPLWDFCTVLALIADPTQSLTTERIEESLNYLSNQVKQYSDFDAVMDSYRCRMVLFQNLSNRFLALCGANQSNPVVAESFMRLSVEAQTQFEEAHDNLRKWKKLASDTEIDLVKRNRIETAYEVKLKY